MKSIQLRRKNIDRLEAIQLRGTRWVCGSQYNRTIFSWSKPSVQCRSELNWPHHHFPLDVIISPSLLLLYDMLHDRSCFNFSMYFTFSSSCTKSHSLSLYCKQSNINSYRYSFLLTMYFYGIAYVTQFCQFLIIVHLNSHYVTS